DTSGNFEIYAEEFRSEQLLYSGWFRDLTSPGRVADLYAGSAGKTSVLLEWSVPGDDGSYGRAARYDIRFAETPPAGSSDVEVSAWFDAVATALPDAPAPRGASAGWQSMTVTGLTP